MKSIARIVACELTKAFIQTEFQKSESPSAKPSLTRPASKTDLTEMISALQAGNVLNKVSADIEQIGAAFESLFNLSLGDITVHSRHSNPQTSETTFLDHLKSRLMERLKIT